MSITRADKLVRRQEHLEEQIREAKVRVQDLEREARLNQEELEATLAEDGVGAFAQRSDGRVYLYCDDLADGKSGVMEAAVVREAKRLEPLGLAPVQIKSWKYPTMEQLRKHRHQLQEIGIDWRDLIDWAPKKTGLRLQTPQPEITTEVVDA